MTRPRWLEIGVIMLLFEMLSFGFSSIPPITFITIIGQVVLYMRIINVPWNKWDVCINSEKVLSAHEFRCLFLSPMEHADDFHLYYNMISYMMKGRSLENHYGSANFAFLLMILSFLTSIGYIVLGYLFALLLNDPYYTKVCAIGFSGVIFALKVVTSCETPASNTNVQGFIVKTRYVVWVELILIHIMLPGASFLGHLAGILAGIIYSRTLIGSFIDGLITSITGDHIVHDPSFYHTNDPEYRADYYSNVQLHNVLTE